MVSHSIPRKDGLPERFGAIDYIDHHLSYVLALQNAYQLPHCLKSYFLTTKRSENYQREYLVGRGTVGAKPSEFPEIFNQKYIFSKAALTLHTPYYRCNPLIRVGQKQSLEGFNISI